MLCIFLSINFLIFFNQISTHCPYIRTSFILSECVFDSNIYMSLNTHILNSNSIDLFGYYSLNTIETNSLNQSLIYHFDQHWMLLVPLSIRCRNQPRDLIFTECQYAIKKSSTIVEYMTIQMNAINFENLGKQSVLYLPAGEIILRSCKAYDCAKQHVYLTASNETFHFRINYEKSIGSSCQTNSDCDYPYSLSNLIHCDQSSRTCQCLNENIHTIDLNNIGRLCIDSIDQSNCTKSPQRCLKWCEQSPTSFCICPKLTRKVKKINEMFDCELEPTDLCRLDEINIRKCPTGTVCDGHRCQSLTIYRQLFEDTPDGSTHSPSTRKTISSINFTRFIIFISFASLVFLILILFLLILLTKSHRLRCFSSSNDKISSSSSSSSTTTTTSTDIYQLKVPYEQSFPGLIPQAYLSPRFYRQQHLPLPVYTNRNNC